MSIQDDIFYVDDALEGNESAKEQFDRIVEHIGNLERSLEDYMAFHKAAVDLKLAIKKLEKSSK